MTKKKKEEEIAKEEPQAEPQAEPPQEEKQDYYDQLLRLQADFENYRKRVERERPLLIELGKEKVIEKFLPLYDVMLKARAEIEKGKGDSSSLKSGLEMVFKELEKIFDSEGVKPIDCLGKECDHELHEVLTTLPSSKDKDGKVVEEVQKGFTLNGKVLRHSKVCTGRCDEEVK